MIIPINLTLSASNPKLPSGLAKISHDEVVVVELQGSIELESSHPSDKDGKYIGELKIDGTNKPTLLIGHHLLEGKIANLSKPLGVLVRSRLASGSTRTMLEQDRDDADVEMENLDEALTTSDSDERVEWDMVAVVKRKIVFSNRPIPIVKLNK